MHLDDFDYQLPQKLIAQAPVDERDQSRLMVIDRKTRSITHRLFRDFHEYVTPGDLLVVNDTKVRPARLFGTKESGGKVEVLLLEPISSPSPPDDGELWEALVKAHKKPKVGASILIDAQLTARLLEKKANGLWNISLEAEGSVEEIVQKIGRTPLPPYIKPTGSYREKQDRERYQTIFAQKSGSSAAPTAGLHFTDTLIDIIRRKGVEILTLTLHVGLGTFQPVRVESIENHRMHREYYEVSPHTADILREAFRTGRRVVACGTTSVRALETIKRHDAPLCGYTDLFIYPGYRFETIQGMITNFHLPRSTLLMLVSAFAGKELVFRAYREAIEQEYRFYSYGDAMLIV